MLGLNKIMLIGTVGHAPETRYIGPGVSFTRISLATSENVPQAGGRMVEQTEWHEVVAFRALSDFVAQYVKKGDALYVEGKLKSRYISDGPESGHKIFEVLADRVQILQRSRSYGQSPIPGQQPQQAPADIRIGAGLPGFDIENLPSGIQGDGDSLPF